MRLNKILFTAFAIVDIVAIVGIGFTFDTERRTTNDALLGIVGLLTPILVVWLMYFGILDDDE